MGLSAIACVPAVAIDLYGLANRQLSMGNRAGCLRCGGNQLAGFCRRLELDGLRGVVTVLTEGDVVVEVPRLPAPFLRLKLRDQRLHIRVEDRGAVLHVAVGHKPDDPLLIHGGL